MRFLNPGGGDNYGLRYLACDFKRIWIQKDEEYTAERIGMYCPDKGCGEYVEKAPPFASWIAEDCIFFGSRQESERVQMQCAVAKWAQNVMTRKSLRCSRSIEGQSRFDLLELRKEAVSFRQGEKCTGNMWMRGLNPRQ